ncbi:MAG: hypothetical protein M1405_02355 [Patescibacteria group bacterium]|nr:hypothetical protein [Patescibacteria group bacterium]
MSNQHTHPWTIEEIEFLNENISKMTYKQMGVIIHRSPNSIQSKIRYLPIQAKIKKYKVNSNFFKIWSPEMAYVLGFIGADGNVCRSGRGHTLHIACDDKDVVEKIKSILSYEGPIHQKVRDNGKISYSIRICDQVIFNDLIKLGITERKSLTFTPPKIPKNLIRHFIRGYFDGDGSVSLRNISYKSKLVVDFYTASQPMSEFLYRRIKQLLKNSYNGKIIIAMEDQKTPYYRINLGQKSAFKLFAYMYKDTNLYLERKYNKFIEGINYGN